MLRMTLLSLVLLTTACSAPTEATPEPAAASSYPKQASEVLDDSRYSVEYESEKTGIAYYVREVSTDELGRLPEDFVIESESTSWVFVPIKDGKIVRAPLEDRIGLGYAITQ